MPRNKREETFLLVLCQLSYRITPDRTRTGDNQLNEVSLPYAIGNLNPGEPASRVFSPKEVTLLFTTRKLFKEPVNNFSEHFRETYPGLLRQLFYFGLLLLRQHHIPSNHVSIMHTIYTLSILFLIRCHPYNPLTGLNLRRKLFLEIQCWHKNLKFAL